MPRRVASDDGRVATFWTHSKDYAEPLGARWRSTIPARHLPAEVRVESDFSSGLQRGEAAIFVLPRSRGAIHMVDRARELGFRTLLEVDDGYIWVPPHDQALYKMSKDSLVPKDFDAVVRAEAAKVDRHRELARRVDGVIVTMPKLAELYRPLNPNVFVCPNSIDPDDWPAELRAQRKPGPFRIGYAGNPSHSDDVTLVREAFSWASQQPDVEVHFVGWHPRDLLPLAFSRTARHDIDELWKRGRRDPQWGSDRANAIAAEQNAKVDAHIASWDFPITVAPWVAGDAARYAENIAAPDVGLCPISSAGPWNEHKSDLKPLEYAAVGALPIVSDHHIYDDWRGIVPMAGSPEEFVELVQWAATHRDEVHAKAAAVWEHVERTRTIDVTIGRWREAIAAPMRDEVAA